jgi:hypothetical protein
MLALAAGVAVVAIVLWPAEQAELGLGQAPAAPAAPAPAPAPATFGLRVEGENIVLPRDGWGPWMGQAPEAVTAAIRAGAGGARGVTIALMQRALPEYRWPPHKGDPGYAQWNAIVRTVAESFGLDTEPEPRRGPFHVVQDEA